MRDDLDPVASLLVRLGGVADHRALVTGTSRHLLARAVAEHAVIRLGRGRYGLPELEAHRAAAVTLNGALDLVSAAMHHGWKVKEPPSRPQVVVPRGRNVSSGRRTNTDLRWGEVSSVELRDGVTSPVRTVLECARQLPFDAALSVADSALRAGMSRSTLLLAAARLPRTGRGRAFEVVEAADSGAANPFESVLRAVLRDVPGTDFEPQVWIENIGRADLVDRRRRLVVEADSFEFHSDSAALHRDTERYNAFAAASHTVLRFGWRHAMFEQDYVRAAVLGVVTAQERSVRSCPTCAAA